MEAVGSAFCRRNPTSGEALDSGYLGTKRMPLIRPGAAPHRSSASANVHRHHCATSTSFLAPQVLADLLKLGVRKMRRFLTLWSAPERCRIQEFSLIATSPCKKQGKACTKYISRSRDATVVLFPKPQLQPYATISALLDTTLLNTIPTHPLYQQHGRIEHQHCPPLLPRDLGTICASRPSTRMCRRSFH